MLTGVKAGLETSIDQLLAQRCAVVAEVRYAIQDIDHEAEAIKKKFDGIATIEIK